MSQVDSSRPSPGAVLKEREFWLLAAVTILYFYRPLFFGETFYYRDLFMHFFPQKKHLVEFVKSGILPLWDPYLHGGQPFLADINNVALYPSNVLYFFLPAVTAFNIDIVFHVLLAAAGAYCLARILGFAPVAAAISGLIFGYCGYTQSLTNLMNWLISASYLPLTLLLWHLFLQEQKRSWFLLTVLTCVFQLLGGAPEVFLIGLGTLLLWSFIYPTRIPAVRRIASWLILVAVVLGIACIQLLPAFEMIRQSARQFGHDYTVFGGWSVPPKRIPEFFIPGFMGQPTSLLEKYYWGATVEDLRSPYILSIYWGLPVLFLAGAGAAHRAVGPVPLRTRILLGVLTALCLVLSLGRHLPFFHFFYDYVGILRSFRYPVKILTAALLPMSILAAAGAQSLFAARPERGLRIFLWITAILTGLVLFVTLVPNPAIKSVLEFFFQRSDETVLQGIRSSLLHLTGVWMLTVLLLELQARKSSPWPLRWMGIVVAVDLLIAAVPVTVFAPRALFTEPGLPSLIRAELKGGRLYRPAHLGTIAYRFPAQPHNLARWNMETLNNYLGSLYNLPIIFHEDFDQLAKAEISRMERRIKSLPWEERIPWLSAAGVTLVLTNERSGHPDLSPLMRVENLSNRPFYLYRNERALPGPYFVGEAIVLPDGEKSLAGMDSDFDPRTAVILTEGSPAGGCSGGGNVRPERIETLFRSYRVEAPCDGYLVFPDPFYPGWKIRDNGSDATIIPANYAFSAIPLKAGSHFVEKRYAPDSFFNGAVVSLCSLLLLLTLLRFLPARELQ